VSSVRSPQHALACGRCRPATPHALASSGVCLRCGRRAGCRICAFSYSPAIQDRELTARARVLTSCSGLARADRGFADAHAFASYAHWLIPGRLLAGRYPYVEPSRCRSAPTRYGRDAGRQAKGGLLHAPGAVVAVERCLCACHMSHATAACSAPLIDLHQTLCTLHSFATAGVPVVQQTGLLCAHGRHTCRRGAVKAALVNAVWYESPGAAPQVARAGRAAAAPPAGGRRHGFHGPAGAPRAARARASAHTRTKSDARARYHTKRPHSLVRLIMLPPLRGGRFLQVL